MSSRQITLEDVATEAGVSVQPVDVPSPKEGHKSPLSQTQCAIVWLTAVKNLAEAFEHYNEWHPHSALGYRSPREYLRRRVSEGLVSYLNSKSEYKYIYRSFL